MTSGLLVTALLMGAVGIPHCLVMCSVPCSLAAKACEGPDQTGSELTGPLQLGRLFGYSVLGALAASVVSFAHFLGVHVSALRPLWVMAQAAILVVGLVLLSTGRLPQWLQTAQIPLYRLSARLNSGRLSRLPPQVRALLVGTFWAVLPCAQLYAAVVLASMANDVIGGAMVMVAYATPGVLSLWFGGHWLTRLFARNAPEGVVQTVSPIEVVRSSGRNAATLNRVVGVAWAVRITGAVLAVSAVLMLTHSAGKLVQIVCG